MNGLTPMSGAVALAALDLTNVTAGWEKLGIVSLLILAVIAIWREGQKRQDRLERIIDANTSAFTVESERLRSNTEILIEIKNVTQKCRREDRT